MLNYEEDSLDCYEAPPATRKNLSPANILSSASHNSHELAQLFEPGFCPLKLLRQQQRQPESAEQPPAHLLPAVNIQEKALIPGFMPGDGPNLVNAKQARRIIIMRKKQCKKMFEAMKKLPHAGFPVAPEALFGITKIQKLRHKNFAR